MSYNKKQKEENSTEEFYESLLKPRFERALKVGLPLFIDFDGGFGYLPSFLIEAFGRLAAENTSMMVLKNMLIKTDEDCLLPM